MPTFIPKHCMVLTVKEVEASQILDTHYSMGWRAVSMAVHSDGLKITFLLEKAGKAKDN
jgi:hypothetical protein